MHNLKKTLLAAAVAGLMGGSIAMAQTSSPPLTAESVAALSVDDLSKLGKLLLTQQPLPEADLRTLAASLAGRLTVPEGGARLDGKFWNSWQAAAALQSYMPAATKDGLAAKLRGLYTDSATLGAAEKSEVELAQDLGQKLGDAQAGDLMARWVGASTEWQSYDASKLLFLVSKMPATDLGRAARAKISGVVASKALSDAAAIRALNPWTLADLVKGVADQWDAPTRAACAAKVQQAYADAAGLDKVTKPGDLEAIVWTLKKLGSEAAGDMTAQWVLASQNYTALSAEQLAKLLGGMQGTSKAVTDARVKMAEFVKTQWLVKGATVPATAALTAATARNLVSALQPGLAPELAAALREAYRAAFMPALASLKFADLKTWVWDGNGDKAGRAKLLAAWLGASADLGSLQPADWAWLVGEAADQLDATTRAACAAKVQQTYGNAAGLTRLTKPADLATLVDVLRKLGSAAGDDLTPQWVLASQNYTALSAEQLTHLLGAMQGISKAVTDARVKMAEFVKTQWLVKGATAPATAALTAATARSLVSALQPGLAPELAAALREGYRAAFMPAVASLKFEDLHNWTWDGESDQAARTKLLVAWIGASPALASLQPAAQLNLLNELRGTADDVRAARQKVVALLQTTLLKDANTLRGLPADHLRAFAGQLTPEGRAQLVFKLHEAYDDPAVLRDVSLANVLSVIDVLSGLRDPMVTRTMALYLTSSEAWRSATPAQWGAIALRLQGSSPEKDEAVKRLRDQVAATLLNDPAVARGVDLPTWRNLASLWVGVAPETQAKWAACLRAAFAADEAHLLTLKAGQLLAFVEVLAKLDSSQANELSWTWLRRAPNRAQEPVKDLVRLAMFAVNAKVSAADLASLFAELDGYGTAASDTPAESLEKALAMAKLYNVAGNKAKFQLWTKRAYSAAVGTEETRQSVSIYGLTDVAVDLSVGELSGHGEEYPELAAALAQKAAAGTLEHVHLVDMEMLGKALSGPQTRAAMEAGMVYGSGLVDSKAAALTAWGYRNAKDLDALKGRIDQKLADAQIQGDAKALWFVARGYTEAVTPDQYDDRRRMAWVDKALAVVVSEPIRLQIARELLRTRPAAEAATILASMQGQFSAEDGAVIRLWLAELQDQAQSQELLERQQRSVAEQKSRRELLQQCQESLSRAQANGDQELIARLQSQISTLQSALQK